MTKDFQNVLNKIMHMKNRNLVINYEKIMFLYSA